ncbi:MAG: AraC family transcriptional regulator [Rhizomicrobium sp.]
MRSKSIPPVSLQVSQSRYCHLEKVMQRSQRGLHVACAGHEVCRADYVVKRSMFPCYGLEYVESGSGTVRLDTKCYPLRAGVLFVYGPGTAHHIVTAPKTPLRKYFVDFFGREASRLLSASLVRPGTALQISDLEAYRVLFEMLLTEGGRGLNTAPKICAALLRILIWKTTGAQSPNTSDGRSSTRTFQHCRDLIDEHHLELQTLGDIARSAGIDKVYLCRLFRSHGYPSPYSYLVRKKISKAAEWLAMEGCRVQEAAQRAGFSDPYHFSRVFKREMGQSPRAFARHVHRSL